MTLLQNVTRGRLLQGFGLLAIVAGSAGVYLTRWGMFGLVLSGIPLWCFGVVAAAGGVAYFLSAMVYGSASSAPARSTRGPERMLFLYLRPFELDARNVLQLLVGASAGVLVYLNLLDGTWIPIAFVPVILNISKEQDFRDALGPLGDFVAFGRPGERLQPVGASRLYLRGGWKREIIGYMVRARLVIVRPGGSRGIRWEVLQVLRTVPPERILFYLRFRGAKKKREREYEIFRRYVRMRLGAELPARLGDARYLVFDASGRPHLIREANRPIELIRRRFARSDDGAAERLYPVLRAVGLEPHRQPATVVEKAVRVAVWISAAVCIALTGTAVVLLMLILLFAPLRIFLLSLGG